MEPARNRHETDTEIYSTITSNSSLFDWANGVLLFLNELYPQTSGVMIRFDRDPVQSVVVGVNGKLEAIWPQGWITTFDYWGYSAAGQEIAGRKTDVPGSIQHEYTTALRESGLGRYLWYRWTLKGALSYALLIVSDDPPTRSLMNFLEHLRPLIGHAVGDLNRRSSQEEHERVLAGISGSLNHKVRHIRGCLIGIRDDRSNSISPEARVMIERAELSLSGIAQIAQDITDLLRLLRAPLPLHPISMKTILTETCMQLDEQIGRYKADIIIEGAFPIVSVNHMGILLVMRHMIMAAIIRIHPGRARIRIGVDVSGGEFARVTLWPASIDRYESDACSENHSHDAALRHLLIRQGIERMGGRCCDEFEDSGDGSIWFELRQYPAVSTHRTQIVLTG